jgi:hypothetical protein
VLWYCDAGFVYKLEQHVVGVDGSAVDDDPLPVALF